MDIFWKVTAAIFALEFGDKTMIGGFSFAAKYGFWVTFLASSTALVASSLLAVSCGGVIGKYVPERATEFGSALLFLLIGAYGLYRFFFPAH